MNRTLLYTTATAMFLGLAAAPVLAQSNNTGNNNGTPNNAQNIVDQSAQVVNQIEQNPKFDHLLKQAKGVFIVPTLSRGAFIVGGEGGQGVLMKHDSSGTWSDPAFMSIGSISVGAQAGGESGPVAMLLMTQNALNDFKGGNNFSIGPHSGLSIVNYSKQGEASAGKGDVIIWSAQSGAFAGASLKGADISQDTGLDHSYYHKQVETQQILNGRAHNESAMKLTNKLPS